MKAAKLSFIQRKSGATHIKIEDDQADDDAITGLILGLPPANKRRRYFKTMSHIGWQA